MDGARVRPPWGSGPSFSLTDGAAAVFCRTVLVFAVALSLGSSLALGGGVIRDSLGARSSGRGGTNLAFGDNGEVLYDNPGGILGFEGDELFELGVDTLLTDLRYSDPDNPVTSAENDPFPMGQITYLRRSQDGVWAYGIGAYSVAGFSAEYTLNSSVFGPQQQYNSLGLMAKVLPGLACRVNDQLTIGGTFGVAASHMELEGPYYIQGPTLPPGFPLMLDLQASGAAITWSLGMQYELTERTTIGAAYTSETQFGLHGPSTVEVPGLGASRYDTRLNVTWPQSVGLGIKHKICPHRIIAADVIWYGWSQAFDSFRLWFNNPGTPGFPPIYEEFPLGWKDTVAIRTGYEWRPVDNRVVRLGYIYNPNPIPDETLTPFIQATIVNTFSVGYGWITESGLEIDLAYQYGFGKEQFVGTSGVAGGDADNSQHLSQVHWIYASLIRRY